MGRKCPLGGYVLYLDCLECDERRKCRDGRVDGASQNNRSQTFQALSQGTERKEVEEWQN